MPSHDEHGVSKFGVLKGNKPVLGVTEYKSIEVIQILMYESWKYKYC